MIKYSFLLLPLIVILSGCGDGLPETFPVAGKVVFADGTSPQFGDIEFFNEELKLNAHGKINKDGTFTVGTFDVDDGAVAGEHKVIIIQRTRNHLMAFIDEQVVHDHGDLVDKRHFDYRKSGLLTTVKAVELNELEIEVKKMPPKEQSDSDGHHH